MDQENMLLPMSKKTIFREAVADSNETELELSDLDAGQHVTKKTKQRMCEKRSGD